MKQLEEAYGDEIAAAASSVFIYGYYTAGQALLKGLEAGRRRHLRPEAAPGGAGGRSRWRATRRRRATSSSTTTARRSATSSSRRSSPTRPATACRTWRRSGGSPTSTRRSAASSRRTRPRLTAEPEVRRRPRPAVGGQGRRGLLRQVTSWRHRTIRRQRRADPPPAGGRPALRRRPRRLRRRPRVRRRRAPGHPRPERRRQDHAVQPDLGRVPADSGNRRAVRAGRDRRARAQRAPASGSRARSRPRACSSA